MRLRCRWLLTLRRVHGGLGLLLLGLLLLWWHGVFVLRSLYCSCGLPLDRFAHPRTPFLLVAAGGQLGRLFRVRIPCWAGFFLATRVEIECKLLFAPKSGPSDFPKSSRRQRPPPRGAWPCRNPLLRAEKKISTPPPLQEGPSQGRASEGRARGKQTRVKPARNLPEPKDNMGHKNVWNSHPRKYGLGSHPW